MSAYFIANVQITDREKFEAYQKGILHTIKPFGGWILAASPGRMLEGGELKNHNVIIRFPTTEHVQGWWDSPWRIEKINIYIYIYIEIIIY